MVDSSELTNNRIDQQFGLNLPSYFSDRPIRTTKFPRIGRSLFGGEEMSSSSDVITSTSSEENSDENIDQRSVLFPRIGKRAFHNLLWANSRSNPHRMLDGQGRYHTNGYDYHIHQVRPQSTISRYRVKRHSLM